MIKKSNHNIIMLSILSAMIAAGEYYFPRRSTPEDMAAFRVIYDPILLEKSTGTWAKWAFWWIITVFTMNALSWSLFLLFRYLNPEKMPMTHFWAQAPVILINFF